MKLKTKLLILVVAVLASFIGFSLIASPVVDVVIVGKKAGYEIISNYLAKPDSAPKSITS
ncbi:MAG: hypothetical protein PVF22_00160 [Candidatus Aminicenantes bacterium]